MNNKPITIQTFYPTGDTRGTRVSVIDNSTITALLIPRRELSMAIKSRTEMNSSGIYFLFGKDVAEGQDAVECYIGESETLGVRLSSHNRDKDFWEIAIAFTSNNPQFPLNKADIKYMEVASYNLAMLANRYYINQETPASASVNEFREHSLKDLLKTVETMLDALGFPLFNKLVDGTNEEINNEDIFYIHSRSSNAKGEAVYTNEGFIVLKGSVISSRDPNGGSSKAHLIQELLDKKIIDETLTFTKDHLMSSPSAAAGLILKGSYNGWDVWKNNKSKTLNEVYREG